MAAADASRDAAALVLALADHDEEAQAAILHNCDHPEILAVSLAALVITAIPDRDRLREWVAGWREAADKTEIEAS
jgi:hypothetical protein